MVCYFVLGDEIGKGGFSTGDKNLRDSIMGAPCRVAVSPLIAPLLFFSLCEMSPRSFEGQRVTKHIVFSFRPKVGKEVTSRPPTQHL